MKDTGNKEKAERGNEEGRKEREREGGKEREREGEKKMRTGGGRGRGREEIGVEFRLWSNVLPLRDIPSQFVLLDRQSEMKEEGVLEEVSVLINEHEEQAS